MSTSTTTFEPSNCQMEAKTEMDSSQTHDRIPKEEIDSNFKTRLGIYTGDMMKGKRHGQSVFVLSSFCRAIRLFMIPFVLVCYWTFDIKFQVNNSDNTGQIWHYKRHGLGVGSVKDQGVYNGSWVNGLRHGFGTMSWEDLKSTQRGDVYVGEWRDDQMAHGVYTYLNGAVYTGDFVDNMYHGYGVLNYTDGSSYAGQFNFNWREGNGTLTEEKSKYTGQFVKDKKEGYGEQYFTSTRKLYAGQFHNNRRHGHGSLGPILNTFGEKCEGEWWNGAEQGYFKCSCCGENRHMASFEGFMNDGERYSGISTSVLPFLWTRRITYKEGKIAAVDVTLFSLVTFPVYDFAMSVLILVLLSLLIFLAVCFCVVFGLGVVCEHPKHYHQSV